jgi:hypothetical protein
MPRRKSSEKAHTTDKIFSKEQVKTLTMMQLLNLQKQGWKFAEPAPEWGSYNYTAPGFDPAKDMISPSEGDTYVAGTEVHLRLKDTEVESILHYSPLIDKFFWRRTSEHLSGNYAHRPWQSRC